MSIELWNTLGICGTLLIIAGTAFAALIQLRHMRRGNQISALTQLKTTYDSPQFVAAQRFVFSELASHMRDPAFRYQVAHKTDRTPAFHAQIAQAEIVGNAYEMMGMFAKIGLVQREPLLDTYAAIVIVAWDALADLIAALRGSYGQAIYENFEYLVVLSQDWQRAHVNGTYPRNVRRVELPNRWQSEDEQFVATLDRE